MARAAFSSNCFPGEATSRIGLSDFAAMLSTGARYADLVSRRLTARRAAEPREVREDDGIRGEAGESETHRTAGGRAAESGRQSRGRG